MRLRNPRVQPLEESQWTEDQRKVLTPFAERGQLFNIYTTLGHNTDALQGFLAWGSYVLRHSSLPPRERELVILRVGYLCKSGYEWAQHCRLGLREGLTERDINSIKIGSDGTSWNDQDRLLLQAAEELHADYFIKNSTWQALNACWSQTQCMDLVFIVGHYTQVCMILNTFGIQLDEGLVADPDLYL